MPKESSVGGAMIYKSMERYFMLAFQMIVQIVVARILSPSDYGIVAMMSVFIAIANVFIQNGFNMAIIQKETADVLDYSTALTLNILIGLFLYILLFLSAPSIANFYMTPDLKIALRVLALILPIGAVSSIQNAIATRMMHFQKLFTCNVIASVSSGIIGISAALLGFGYWALISQQMSSVIIVAIALTVNASWKPHLEYSKQSAKEMFSFGVKLLVAGLINQIYNQLNSLVIGRKYTSADLAFYTKGRMFPGMITNGVDSALQSVSLSVFSKKQNDKKALYALMSKILCANTFITIPILTFLFVCAPQIISFLLTEKWLPVVPYLRLCCVTFMFHPITSICLQSIASVGRSDIRLKLEFIKKPIGILLLILFIPYGPLKIALGAFITTLLGVSITVISTHRIVGYRVGSFMKSLMPSFCISTIMGLIVYLLSFLFHDTNPLVELLIEGGSGFMIYLILSKILKIQGLQLLTNQIMRQGKNFNHEKV